MVMFLILTIYLYNIPRCFCGLVFRFHKERLCLNAQMRIYNSVLNRFFSVKALLESNFRRILRILCESQNLNLHQCQNLRTLVSGLGKSDVKSRTHGDQSVRDYKDLHRTKTRVLQHHTDTSRPVKIFYGIKKYLYSQCRGRGRVRGARPGWSWVCCRRWRG